ncbi:MAG: ribbon-helix-helix domain-containing protein [Syntrophaceae bacterium]|nr:ribbon-helix-helix domain-containing protein [Syntrophaceae bacterium]
MPRLGIHLTTPEVNRLREISTRTGLAVSELIRRSLDDWLERYEEKERIKREEDPGRGINSTSGRTSYRVKTI